MKPTGQSFITGVSCYKSLSQGITHRLMATLFSSSVAEVNLRFLKKKKSDTKQKKGHWTMCERAASVLRAVEERGLVMYGNGHQLLEVKLLEATMRGFTGRNIFHALEHVTSRYVGR